jgi:hypothetical protein
MPLYDNGSLGSTVLDLGIGLIIILPQTDGIIHFFKADIESICKKDTE